MADKYRVRSVKSPVLSPPPGSPGYIYTFTDWVELELIPYLGPSIAAVGGYDARFKILISPKTYTELKPARLDIISLDPVTVMRAPKPAEIFSVQAGMGGETIPPRETIPSTVKPGNRSMQATIEDMIVQLKRLNDNLEKRQ